VDVSRVPFIPPALPRLRASAPTGEGWLYELKFDGYRVQLHKDGFSSEVYDAEGAPTETFQPFENRRTFDNRQDYEDLYGAEQTIIHAPFAPQVAAPGARFQLRSRMRSAASPWWDIRIPFDITRGRVAPDDHHVWR
jgi:hypothetical protein